MEEKVVTKKRLSYFRKVQEEFKKISWTSKEELISNTKVVISSIFLFGIGIYIADLVIRSLLSGVGNIFKMVVG
jgi:preprotein translocase SecE subunit